MVILKSREEIALMREAGKLVAACHQEIAKLIRPGIATREIDQFVEKYLAAHGARAEQKGYQGYAFATCTSVNDVICHGFPDKNLLREGDIVAVDFVANLNGWLADSTWTYPVGQISAEAERLLKVTKEALYLGIAQAVAGNRIGDISHAVQAHVEAYGFSVVRDFTGHGIGRTIHEDPPVFHAGPPGRGLRLREGMVITVEPMVNIGAYHTRVDLNGWTARTVDGTLSAQYEHTVAITEEGPFILTQP
ncbi:MAG: type I methionyl aminopeptidase [Firmicutes bacterium]|nr:type I methionyl aminopeptidase [Bacillota bacterium]